MERIDAATVDHARGKDGLSAIVERYRFFNEILSWHAKGEERGVFPVLETVAPLVAEAYARDHRGLDSAFVALDTSYSRHDRLETARAAAAFRYHLKMHLDKEDAHLYRVFEERIPLPEQARSLEIVAGAVPRERFSEVVAWLYPLIGQNDRENMTRILQTSLPAPVFAGVRELIKQAVGSDWVELTRRIPRLNAR